MQTKVINWKNISEFQENLSVFPWFTAQTEIQTDRKTGEIKKRTEMKWLPFPATKENYKIGAFVHKLSWNKKLACTIIRGKKIFKKMYLKNSLQGLLKNSLYTVKKFRNITYLLQKRFRNYSVYHQYSSLTLYCGKITLFSM